MQSPRLLSLPDGNVSGIQICCCDNFIRFLLGTILTSQLEQNSPCSKERPYSALGSSDAEIGSGRAYAVPPCGCYARTHR